MLFRLLPLDNGIGKSLPCLRREDLRLGYRPGPWFLLFWALVSNSLALPLTLVDPSFAVGTGADGVVNALYVQPDQRILVGGGFMAMNGQANSFLARLNSDGSVDSSLNLQGTTDNMVYRLLGLPDGKILVAGAFKTLLGASREGLARLTTDGTVDPTFDAGSLLDGTVFALAVQGDGRVWVGISTAPASSRILRLEPDGAADNSYLSTNDFTGYVFALLSLTNGGVLAGINPQVEGSNACLVSLQPDGQINTNFDVGLGSNASVFSLVQEPDGHVLVGGQLTRPGVPGSVPLLRMTSDLRWDSSFNPDSFTGDALSGAVIDSLLLQPDGKIIAGGYFFEVGGYWRRELVRLTGEGHVDVCFDPGLGLGGATPAGPVRSLLLQNDGRILVGGVFDGIDGMSNPQNLARLLPQGPCDVIRVYLEDAGGTPPSHHFFAAATFPPGGTNVLETSTDLQNWRELARDTVPYIYVDSGAPVDGLPPQFFRARQEH